MASSPSLEPEAASGPAPASLADYKEPQPISVVQLDGLVLLKIIKHCKESHPELVTGQLLGLDVDTRLEITHAFPSPSTDDAGYQAAMMKALRAVNVDHNTVGWYQSAVLGNFLTPQLLEAQYDYQKAIRNSVVVVYDPMLTTAGRLAIKAFRLSDAFMEQYAKTGALLADASISSSAILEELPIKVHNSHLVHGFLYEMREQKNMSCDFDRLTLSMSGLLEKNMEELSKLIDDYAAEQGKFQFHQRQLARTRTAQQQYLAKQEAENEARLARGEPPLPKEDLSKNPLFKPVLPKPSRLESLLIAKQISYHAAAINSTATQGFDKLYVVEALNKTDAQSLSTSVAAAAAASVASSSTS